MFLSSLELVGFKSFANRTIFKFNGGITAIVGPNGCGKTNVVDAVRWVLGEHRSSLLRSEIMEDVIFNGSALRKPLGMAEVSITLDNQMNVLPTHFSQVTITRKVFRNGESEYYLNNTPCRLKDIIDLLMDTGIGHNSYSIIELKMIESLLNGNIDDRRKILEEAAGVAKYKQRKKETEKKLLNVEQDLQRVNDLIQEMEQRVRTLSRQAQKTKRYIRLQDELKNIELNLWKVEFDQINSRLTELEEDNKKWLLEKTVLDERLAEVLEELQILKISLDELENNLENVREDEAELNSKISDIKNKISLNKERKNNIGNSIEKLTKERFEIRNLITKFDDTLTKLTKLKEQKQDELTEFENVYRQISGELSDERNKITDCKIDLERVKEKRVELENKIKFLNFRQTQLESSKALAFSKLKELEAKISGANDSLATTLEKIKTLESDLESINSKKKELEQVAQNLREMISEESLKLENIRRREQEVRISLNEVITSLEFLNSILEVDESTKFLIKESGWAGERKYSLLSEILTVDEKFRIAFDSALGQFKNLIIVQNEKDLNSAIETLTGKHKGKCFFAVLENVSNESVNREPPENPRIIGYISELPIVDNKIRNILRIIFGTSVLVRDLNEAKEVANENIYDFVVTLSGEIVYSGFLEKRGSVLHREGIAIGKLDRINKLLSKKENLESELDSIKDEASVCENRKIEFEKELQNYQNEIESLNHKSKTLEFDKTNLMNKCNNYENQIKDLNNEKKDKEGEIVEIEKEFNIHKKELELLEKEIDEVNKDLNFKAEKLKSFEDEFEKQDTQLRSIEKTIVRLTAELDALTKEILRVENSKEMQIKKLQGLDKELVKLKNSIEEIARKIVEEESIFQELTKRHESIRAKKSILIENLREKEENFNLQDNYKDEIQHQIETLTEKIYRNEIEITRGKEQANSLFRKALEIYNVNLNDFRLDENLSLKNEDLPSRAEKVRQTLNSLGQINFLALQEYEEQSERLHHYKTQVGDLKKSKETLDEALVEINQTATKKFLETFDKVNDNFAKVFKELFGNDSTAELVIDRNNPLESEVEIRAKPSGKKIHSIDTLSQGEKTLVLLSLLFGIYLVKPSPFCILDEVDAPLDDSNVERFLNLLRSFSKDIQFILITHNKRTMEFANTLYGVTMTEDGVSKVLSVKLVD
ncbi:MAG: chromosome segregation protein SMC [Ignavibacteria bacterium]|nr:chromosome segregation protein SMC [Ignavibacteria bacterium]